MNTARLWDPSRLHQGCDQSHVHLPQKHHQIHVLQTIKKDSLEKQTIKQNQIPQNKDTNTENLTSRIILHLRMMGAAKHSTAAASAPPCCTTSCSSAPNIGGISCTRMEPSSSRGCSGMVKVIQLLGLDLRYLVKRAEEL